MKYFSDLKHTDKKYRPLAITVAVLSVLMCLFLAAVSASASSTVLLTNYDKYISEVSDMNSDEEIQYFNAYLKYISGGGEQLLQNAGYSADDIALLRNIRGYIVVFSVVSVVCVVVLVAIVIWLVLKKGKAGISGVFTPALALFVILAVIFAIIALLISNNFEAVTRAVLTFMGGDAYTNYISGTLSLTFALPCLANVFMAWWLNCALYAAVLAVAYYWLSRRGRPGEPDFCDNYLYQ